ncbi:hypothetical protein HDU97_004148 [Phlyctochytrium planicorne]|nr:hypothetical protein HDU97_004148 [Phlyctochytrium planicorne]
MSISPYATPSPFQSPFQMPITATLPAHTPDVFAAHIASTMPPPPSNTNMMMHSDQESLNAAHILSEVPARHRSPLWKGQELKLEAFDGEPTSSESSLPPVNISRSASGEGAHCFFCNATFALFIFYPDPMASSSTNPIDVACMACVAKQLHLSLPSANRFSFPATLSDPEEPDLSLRKRRAKGIRSNQTVYCEACSRKVGFGGVRAGPEDGVDLRANVEIENLLFRTGKWRPRELFEAERKTCSLSHDRLGAIDNFQVTTYRCPDRPIEEANGRLIDSSFDPCPVISLGDHKIQKCLQDPRSSIFRTPRGRRGSAKSMSSFSRFSSAAAATATGVEIIRKRRDQFIKMNELRLMGYWATPAFMASYEGLVGTWDKLKAYSRDWNRQVNDYMVGIRPRSASGGSGSSSSISRRFVVVTDSLRSVKKVTSRRGTEEQMDLLLVGYFFFDWNPFERTVHLSQMYYDGKDSVVNTTESAHNGPLQFMFDAMMDRIQAEMAADGMLPEPQHVWVTIPKAALAERNRAVYHMEKLGFIPLDSYSLKNGQNTAELRARFARSGSSAEGFNDEGLTTTLAITWTELKRRSF